MESTYQFSNFLNVPCQKLKNKSKETVYLHGIQLVGLHGNWVAIKNDKEVFGFVVRAGGGGVDFNLFLRITFVRI